MTDIEKNRYNWNGLPIVYAPSKDISDNSNPNPNIADLFCGPGGISEGFSREGFTPVIGADIHEISMDTYRNNHPESYSILGNIKKINGQKERSSDILDVINMDSYGDRSRIKKILDKSEVKDLDVLAAGIPCQGFSISNKKRDNEDDRNYLFEELVRAAKITDPEVILIENVSTMKSADDGSFVDAINKCLGEMGYDSEHNILNAADYGVPQKRKRLFFIATKSGEIVWPKKTHKNNHITVNEAISDLEPLKPYENGTTYIKDPQNNYQKKMRRRSDSYENHSAPRHQQKTVDRIKNTESGEPMYDNFRQRIRLSGSSPSPTIVAGGIRPQFQFGHPNQNRGLTVRERARLQSFPDDYSFEGGLTQGRVQTGMAVPPILASKIANSIRENIIS